MTIKTCKTAVRASTLLAAFALSGGAFGAGASGDSYTFATDGTLGASPYEALAGNGTVATDAYTYSAAVGKPLSGEDTSVLEIAGTAQRRSRPPLRRLTSSSRSSRPTNWRIRLALTFRWRSPLARPTRLALRLQSSSGARLRLLRMRVGSRSRIRLRPVIGFVRRSSLTTVKMPRSAVFRLMAIRF